MRWKGTQSKVLLETAREVDVEGAIRAGKTTVCLWKEHEACRKYPGIPILLARWTDEAVFGLIVPLWNIICETAGDAQEWNSKEACFDWRNGSRIYIRGLKSQDQTLRYSKLRGYTIARAYVDQAEELPHDIYLELAGRLSAPGFPHQITISPQAIEETHWIAKEFPSVSDDPHRKYFALSVYDNAHNLDPGVIPALERLYPPSHPKHRTLIQGVRGMNVTGEPVYAAAFVRQLHETVAEYDPALPLDMALDFGKHHPCVVFRQTSALGQVRFLGGILGQQLYLDDFIDLVLKYRTDWFPDPCEIRECCDPAGTVDTSHGTLGAIKTLEAKGVRPRSRPDSNSPAVRIAVVERLAALMRKRAANRDEALVVSNSDRWLRISAQATLVDRFLADGFEAGYVWDEHMVSVNNKQVRKPKKDGWYEHGQNCLHGDTRVVTIDGLVAIRDLAACQGELQVLSRDGVWVTAASARRTRQQAEMRQLKFNDGTTVVCTPNHRFLTPDGWKTAENMLGSACYNAVCQSIQTARYLSSFRARSIGVPGRIISGLVSVFTELFGPPSMVPCHQGVISTTPITSRTTIGLRIWNVFRDSTISVITENKGSGFPRAVKRSKRAASGMPAPMAARGIASTMSALLVTSSIDAIHAHVSDARVSSRVERRSPLRGSFAVQIVGRKIVRRAVLTMKNGAAWCVMRLIRSIGSLARKPVGVPVKIDSFQWCVSVASAPPADVYCLDVPGTRAFCIESGLVTHNCAEYLELNFGSDPPKVRKPRAVGPPPPRGDMSWAG